MNQTPTSKNNGDSISRDDLLAIINSALRLKESNFVRQTILHWLAAYPGDLYFNYLYARTLVDEAKHAQAISILEMLEKTDPEFAPAYELHYKALVASGSRNPRVAGCYFGLTGRKLDSIQLPAWSSVYRESQKAFGLEKLEEAEFLVQQALIADPMQVLPAILHLQAASLMHDVQTTENLANLYHSRWTECLQFGYILASAQMTLGFESEAVSLLHTCVTRDSAGQVASHIWGKENPYQSLWPDKQQVKFDITVPQQIASALGWNQLEAQYPVLEETILPALEGSEEVIEPSTYPEETENQAVDIATSANAIEPVEVEVPLSKQRHWSELSADEVIHKHWSQLTPSEVLQKANGPTVEAVKPQAEKPSRKKDKESVHSSISGESDPESVKNIRTELDRIATRLRVPGLITGDRRFPVYVIFTTRKGLEAQYGSQTAFILDELMKQLVETLRKKSGWTALLFYADDSAYTTSLSIKPAPHNDAWKLKLAIADLDKALSKKGEMIGTLLIVGGPEVVPFHMLPNPTDDADTQVASDNPYSSTDDNYFIPEWPIGRLPGGSGRDAGILMRALRQMASDHSSETRSGPWWRRFNIFSPFVNSLQQVLQPHAVINNRPAFGYTAAIWKQASLEVFRPIGDAQSLLSSPPVKTNGLIGSGIFPAKLSYFNLHGVADSAEWYGQPDYDEMQSNPEYPVALAPPDLSESGSTPLIVFSEACYGTHIEQKEEDDALSLKFLSSGTKAMVGSTCVAYGSVTTPLIAADKLGQAFWKQIKDGRTAGEALRNAKISFAQEMNRAQGFLDGEDQKTLISFILLGDPLASITTVKKKEKRFIRENMNEKLSTTNESEYEPIKDGDLSVNVMTQVKSIVEQYLPGLKEANYSLSKQYITSSKANSQLDNSSRGNERTVVTISKQYTITKRVHSHYARLTFDNRGKIVKLAVSR